VSEIVIRIDAEVIAFMYRHQRTELLDMVRSSWLPPESMRALFDVCRPDGGMVIHVARLALSHPNAEVRAMAAVELCAFMPVTNLGRHLWC
jgi:hypothetical protein